MSNRKNIMLGTAGHVDHGKTALVKLLTGCNTDRLAVEQQRGLTIEVGFAPCRMADERIVGIVDVPGHVDFIKNMVAGAHGVDVVLLVVAADDGVMPQTREHLDILTLMGCRAGVVALTKIDLVDPMLRQAAADEVRALLAETFLAEAPIYPVSNLTGEGFDEFLSALHAAADAAEPTGEHRPFHLWIERSFAVRGFGTVATGIPVSGAVRVGDRLRLWASGREVRVRGLEVYGEQADLGRAGECVALNLADIDTEAVARGMVLTEQQGATPADMFEADLTLLPTSPTLKDNLEVHLHIGTAEIMAVVAELTGSALPPGETRLVQMRLAAPLAVGLGERFVIRGNGRDGRITALGGGTVLGVSNSKCKRNRPEILEPLSARAATIHAPARFLLQILREASAAIDATTAAQRAQFTPSATQTFLRELQHSQAVAALPGDLYIAADALAHHTERLWEQLDAMHHAEPTRGGFPAEDVQAALGLDDATFAAVTSRAETHGDLRISQHRLARPGRQEQLPPELQALLERAEARLRDAGLASPRPDELAEALRTTRQQTETVLEMLCDRGRAVRLDKNVILHADAVRHAKQTVLMLFRRGRGFETVEFRDALGVSRKYAVPLLDYFDTIRWTVRQGNRRTPGVEAHARLSEESSEGEESHAEG